MNKLTHKANPGSPKDLSVEPSEKTLVLRWPSFMQRWYTEETINQLHPDYSSSVSLHLEQATPPHLYSKADSLRSPIHSWLCWRTAFQLLKTKQFPRFCLFMSILANSQTQSTLWIHRAQQRYLTDLYGYFIREEMQQSSVTQQYQRLAWAEIQKSNRWQQTTVQKAGFNQWNLPRTTVSFLPCNGTKRKRSRRRCVLAWLQFSSQLITMSTSLWWRIKKLHPGEGEMKLWTGTWGRE